MMNFFKKLNQNEKLQKKWAENVRMCEENWSEKQLWNEILMTVSQRVKT